MHNEMIRQMFHSLTKKEKLLWCLSVLILIITWMIFDRRSFLSLAASIIGVSSLLLDAKGNPIGQILMVIFSILYGIISWTFACYGEMITCLCMTAPMVVLAAISWFKNPFEGQSYVVRVESLTRKDVIVMLVEAAAVTFIFYWILKTLHTSNLAISTLSVMTSFFAALVTWKRSSRYAVAYPANNLVLILLWLYASLFDPTYLSVMVCFLIFFF